MPPVAIASHVSVEFVCLFVHMRRVGWCFLRDFFAELEYAAAKRYRFTVSLLNSIVMRDLIKMLLRLVLKSEGSRRLDGVLTKVA